MKKQKITYGVNGMMEFQAVIKVGKTNLKVQFSDGSFNASSRKPATFTTDNLIVQHAIENSNEFKHGLIHKISTVELNEEVKVLRNGPKALNEPIPIEINADGTQKPASETAEDASETAEDASELKQVEVHCNDDAKDYLADNFGVSKSKLRNKDIIASVAATYGIEFVYA